MKTFIESLLIITISTFLAILLLWFLLPAFASFVERPMEMGLLTDVGFISKSIALFITTCLICSTLPAVYFLNSKPGQLISGDVNNKANRLITFFRNSLVALQFIISTAIILATLVMLKQISFLNSKELGYDSESIITLRMQDEMLINNPYGLIEELEKLPEIETVSGSYNLPSNIESTSTISNWDGADNSEGVRVFTTGIDTSFINLFKIQMTESQDLSRQYNSNESRNYYFLNETALKVLKIKNPVRTQLEFGGQDEGEILGIFKDFHFQSIELEIAPLVLIYSPKGTELSKARYLSIRTKNNLITPNFDSKIEMIIQDFDPDFILDYTYLDQEVTRYNKNFNNTGVLMIISSILMLIVSSAGLYGITLLSMQKRIREIVIRKICGASSINIIFLLLKSYGKLIIVSVFIGWPLSILFLNTWMSNFAYKVGINIFDYLVSLIIVIFFTLLVIGYNIISISTSNPAKLIRVN